MAAARREGLDVVLEIIVQPRAAQTTFAGTHGDSLKIRVAAPPVDGRANAALIEFLAAEFDVPRARVVLIKGASGRRKTVRIEAPGAVPPWLSLSLMDPAIPANRRDS